MEPSSPRYRHSPAELESRLTSLETSPYPAPETRILTLSSAAAAGGDRGLLGAVLRLARERGVSGEALREALTQVYLFAGFPRAINALAELSTVFSPDAEASVDLSPRGDETRNLAAGETLCRRVYGERYEKLLRTMAHISPDLGRWMIQEGYGKVLSAPGLDVTVRELCAVAALFVLDVPSQLRAHLRGSLLVGARVEEVEGVLETAALIAPEGLDAARQLLSELAAEER